GSVEGEAAPDQFLAAGSIAQVIGEHPGCGDGRGAEGGRKILAKLEGALEPAVALGMVAAGPPESTERADHAEHRRCIAGAVEPGEGGAKVVVLHSGSGDLIGRGDVAQTGVDSFCQG